MRDELAVHERIEREEGGIDRGGNGLWALSVSLNEQRRRGESAHLSEARNGRDNRAKVGPVLVIQRTFRCLRPHVERYGDAELGGNRGDDLQFVRTRSVDSKGGRGRKRERTYRPEVVDLHGLPMTRQKQRMESLRRRDLQVEGERIEVNQVEERTSETKVENAPSGRLSRRARHWRTRRG